jgi:hypothetical protein
VAKRLSLAIVALAAVSLSAQSAPVSDPVHVTLRLADGRTSFKSVEPIRLELSFTADRPGFVADVDSPDDASDVLVVSPDAGVFRVLSFSWRDVFSFRELSNDPTTIQLTMNYWVRFDRSGDYTARIETRRAGAKNNHDSWPQPGTDVVRATNIVAFHVDVLSEEAEQSLIGPALARIAGSAGAPLMDQVHAAEELAFLPGDAAALEKHRQYRLIDPLMSNARNVIQRGFRISRRPALILGAFEDELSNLSRAVDAGLLFDATGLRDYIEHPNAPASPVPPRVDLRQNPYVMQLIESLGARTGLAKTGTAVGLVDVLANDTPADVRQIVIDGFDQLSLDQRRWLVTGRWDVIHTAKLGPALMRLVHDLPPRERSAIFPALIDIDVSPAIAPITDALLDPTVNVSPEVLRRVPAGTLTRVAPALLQMVAAMVTSQRRGDEFRIERKLAALRVIADGSIVAGVRDLYAHHSSQLNREARATLLNYLLQWDEKAGAELAVAATQSDPSLLGLVSREKLPAQLRPLARDLVISSTDGVIARDAAALLSQYGERDDRQLLEQRLAQWRREHQAPPWSELDGAFEQDFVSSILNSRIWTLEPAERDQLKASCLTDRCKAAVRNIK